MVGTGGQLNIVSAGILAEFYDYVWCDNFNLRNSQKNVFTWLRINYFKRAISVAEKKTMWFITETINISYTFLIGQQFFDFLGECLYQITIRKGMFVSATV